jgi:hypothetical protein
MRLSMMRAALVLAFTMPAFAAEPIYKDPNRSFEERASDLVAHMTLEEKVAQLGNDAPAIPRLGVPAYAWCCACRRGDRVSAGDRPCRDVRRRAHVRDRDRDRR